MARFVDNKPRNTRKTRKGILWAGSFCINGGITVFETRFARASQNGRRQFRELAGAQIYGIFLRRLLFLRLADRLVPKKVAKATAAVTLLFVSFYDSFKKNFQGDFAIIILTSI